MSNYRVVGSFSVSTDSENNLRIEPQKKSSTPAAVTSISASPINITSSISRYEPIKPYTKYASNRGLLWGVIEVRAGQLWKLHGEQRVVVEAGPSRTIFYKMQGSGAAPQGVYVQSTQAFIDDVTVREVALQVVDKTRATVILAEWEVHFLVGFIGASSWVGFATVIGGDIVGFAVGKRSQNKVYTDALIEIASADAQLKTYAPTLRKKMLAAIFGYAISDPSDTAVKSLEEFIKQSVTDSKVTGRAAGAISAKFVVNPGNGALSAYFVLSTILMQVAFKSASKIPPALGNTVKEKFSALFPDLSELNLNNPGHANKVINSTIENYKKLGVDVSVAEANQMLTEIKNNPVIVYESLEKIVKALRSLSEVSS